MPARISDTSSIYSNISVKGVRPYLNKGTCGLHWQRFIKRLKYFRFIRHNPLCRIYWFSLAVPWNINKALQYHSSCGIIRQPIPKKTYMAHKLD